MSGGGRIVGRERPAVPGGSIVGRAPAGSGRRRRAVAPAAAAILASLALPILAAAAGRTGVPSDPGAADAPGGAARFIASRGSFAPAGAIGSGCLLAAAVHASAGNPETEADGAAEVRRGAIEAILEEAGAVEAREVEQVFSKFTGDVSWMIPEGTRVKPGDVIIRFDETEALERLETAKRNKELAAERLEKLRKDLELSKARRERILAAAELNLREAKLALAELEAKPDPDDLKISETSVKAAGLRLELAAAELESHEALLRKGYVTEAMVRSKALAKAGAEAEWWKEQALSALLKAGAPKDSVRIARLSAAEAERAMGQTKLDLDSNAAALEREIALAEMEVENAKAEFENAQKNLDNAAVRSRLGGIVAYVDIWKGVERSLSPLQLGERRSYGSDLCKVADTSVLQVKLLINEKDLPSVAAGQEAEIFMPAFPGRTFRGRVSFVSPSLGDKNVLLGSLALARRGQAFVQAAEARVDFEDMTEAERNGMRLGLSAVVRIKTGRLEDRLLAPVGALSEVRRLQGETRAVLRKYVRGGAEALEVRVLGRDWNFAAVEPAATGALREGDLVLLSRGGDARRAQASAASHVRREGNSEVPIPGIPCASRRMRRV